jgi:anti-sigma factor RsiW
MHEAIDGTLSAAETAGLGAHLEECAACRDGYARLSEVVAALRALPRAGRPPESTWADIRARIEGVDRDSDHEETKVLTLPTGHAESIERDTKRVRASFSNRGVRLSVPQLAAAAALVAFVSAGVMRLAMRGDTAGVVSAEPELGMLEMPGGAAARAVSLDGDRYAETVARLEQVLAAGRSVLAPETLATIQESLATVDAAIDEIEAALAEDPNSDLLQRLLTAHQGTKLGVLERAVSAVHART